MLIIARFEDKQTDDAVKMQGQKKNQDFGYEKSLLLSFLEILNFAVLI